MILLNRGGDINNIIIVTTLLIPLMSLGFWQAQMEIQTVNINADNSVI